jgi:hypothetical protein
VTRGQARGQGACGEREPGRAKEIPRLQLTELRPQPEQLPLRELTGRGPHSVGEVSVFRVACASKLLLERRIARPFDQVRQGDRRVAAAVENLSTQPVQILSALTGIGEHVDRVLEQLRAELFELAPDSDPKVRGGRRQLMDEQQPLVRAAWDVGSGCRNSIRH